jgi:hypothetical protein
MSPLRILSDKQERDVAIAYLCCVGLDYLRERWSIAPITVANTILNNRAYDWDDPLVEFYRARGRAAVNFAHFYLTYEGADLENKELIDPERDQDVYDALRQDLIQPILKKVAADTGLDFFVEPHTGIEALLNDIFGIRTAEKLLAPLLSDMIHRRFIDVEKPRNRPQPTSPLSELTQVQMAEGLRNRIIYLLKHGGLGITPYKIRLFEKALGRLSRREALILKLYYGVQDLEPFTLEGIGNLLGLTRERVRQIKERAIRRLGNGTRFPELRQIYEFCPDPSLDIKP